MDWEGLVMGSFLFGESPSIGYSQSPQAREMYNTFWPLLKATASGGGWNIPSYNVPDAYGPTKNWFNSISPDVMEGLWEPYEFAASQLGERMGAGGQLGSARGGYSGTAGDSFGRFYAEAGKDIGTQAWNMMSPGIMANWSAQLGQNQNLWMQQLQRNMYPYSIMSGMLGASMPNTVVNQGSQGVMQSILPALAMGWASNW